MLLLDFFTKTSRKEPKYYTWGFRAGSVSSVSGPASMASWTLAPMSFSAGRRAMEKQPAQHVPFSPAQHPLVRNDSGPTFSFWGIYFACGKRKSMLVHWIL